MPTVDLTAVQSSVDELCDIGRYAGLPPAGGTIESVNEVLDFLDGAADGVTPIQAVEIPPALAEVWAPVVSAADDADRALQAASEAAVAGDVVTAERLIDRHIAHLWSVAGRVAVAGLSCGGLDPARAQNASLNVPLDLHAEQLSLGYGSVWVSQKYGDDVVRVDPESGAILATVDVGTDPLKLQPADGRMWVRTADAYVAIDAVTNEVVATLAKSDVGPDANRNYAVDGAMWVCDGERLHRYDTTTLERVATIDVDVRCDFVLATTDLVLAWNTDDEPAESGQSAAAVVDPATNAVVTTIRLPVDVVWPVVLPDAVFFGGQYNRNAVVIDRENWSVTSTIELPDVVGGGGITSDGTSIFVPTRGASPWNVLVLDATTFEVVDTIEPLDVNGVAADDGVLWTTHPNANVLQRFDVTS